MRILLTSAMFVAALTASANADQVPACNADNILATVLKPALDLKAAQIESGIKYAEMAVNASDRELNRNQVAQFQSWNPTIVNVRQEQYDADNNVRYCAATFDHHLSKDSWLLLGIWRTMAGGKFCIDNVTYKIEAVLDKPGVSYVTWQCAR